LLPAAARQAAAIPDAVLRQTRLETRKTASVDDLGRGSFTGRKCFQPKEKGLLCIRASCPKKTIVAPV
jgi:hypothetical protein